MIVVLTLYIVLTLVALFAPLRWAIAAYLLLACIDFPGNRDSIGLLNAFRGFAVPIYLLWRLRDQAGHRAIVLAPVAWALLTVYAAIASFWSYFPTSAFKLAGHMTGSLLIGFVFARAAKGGYLSSRVVIPVGIGSILMGALQLMYLHDWTHERDRFSAFTNAQAYAAFVAALFCMALCAPGLTMLTRALLCPALALSLIFNGSRIWFCGIVLAALIAFIISTERAWVKILSSAAVILAACSLIIFRNQAEDAIQDLAPSNRIVAAAVAAYEGDMQSQGLGTLRFRRIITEAAVDQLKRSSFTELTFGRGTSNGSFITGSLFRGESGFADPNRMVHNEWLRVLYEWGLAGLCLWCFFWCSTLAYVIQGVRNDPAGYSKPLLIYLPALLIALAGENFIAGAGSAMSIGFLMLFGFATFAHRYPVRHVDALSFATLEDNLANAPALSGSVSR